jgi:3-deoxy-7-phosphoheptulonate synthase
MAKSATREQVETVFKRIKAKGFGHEVIHGTTGIDVIGVLGDLSGVEESYFAELDGVEKVVRISKPYKRISRRYAKGAKAGRGSPTVGRAWEDLLRPGSSVPAR